MPDRPASQLQCRAPIRHTSSGSSAPCEAVAGQRYDFMFTEEDRARGVPQHEIELARQTGRSEDDRWHLRCDGSRFWASGLLGRHNDLSGQLLGYVKVVRDRTDLRMRMEALQSRSTRWSANSSGATPRS